MSFQQASNSDRSGPPQGDVVLNARGIRKSYGPVQAIRSADFQLRKNQIHALVGDNGAGKSTLIKILSGAEQPDGGVLELDGEPVQLSSPQRAREYGVETVYQDLALADTLTAAKNVCLGREIMRPGPLGRLGFLDRGAMKRQSRESFDSLGVAIQDVAACAAYAQSSRQAAAKVRNRSAIVGAGGNGSGPLYTVEMDSPQLTPFAAPEGRSVPFGRPGGH